ncbi:MAG: hypothetical protein PWP24_1877 [Clostridiales bacterium]|nr:hypothetical protein [Clostridiales bacterium]
MHTTKEEELLSKRVIELANQAYQQGICTYTSFLNLNEIAVFYKTITTVPSISYELSGGYPEAERRVVCFYEDNSFPHVDFPIQSVLITPLQEKFGEELSHRDYLGAILNLGIKRAKIGDILISGKHAYVFCFPEIAAFLCDSLSRIKNTPVKAAVTVFEEQEITIKKQVLTGTVASVRLDRLLAIAFQSSRSSLIGMIEGGKVFVNGKLITSNGFVPKDGDLISVRGMGRFLYHGIDTKTKKDRYRVTIEKFI